jgi:two-component system chemotaxis response regulator CheB
MAVSGNGKSRGKLPDRKGKGSFSLICPDCDGPLVGRKNGSYTEFQCQVGHVFTLKGLSEAHTDALERGLWIALRRLEEQQTIQALVLRKHEGDQNTKARMGENFKAIEHDIDLLRDIINRL